MPSPRRVLREHATPAPTDRSRRCLPVSLHPHARDLEKQGLVWVKDAELGDWFRRRHPHVRNVRYGGSPRTHAQARTWDAGRAAGERLVLRRGIEGAAVTRGRLLTR